MPAKRKTSGPSPSAPKKRGAAPGEPDQLVTTTVRLARGQWDELRKEALRRSLESDAGDRRPDASRLIREAIDEWLARSGR